MNPQHANNPRGMKTYSPFWALLLVVATLIFLQTFYLIGDFQQRSQIESARQQLAPAFNQARTVSQTTEAVGRELIVLSTNSPEAARIIGEFKIQLNQQAEAKAEN